MQDDTRIRILNAAEELFAKEGFANTSLRTITAHAGVNLAAVNYHFGSKEALIQELFRRRLQPLNQQRLQLLAVLDERVAEPSVEDILEAYLAPTLLGQPDELRFMRLLGRTQAGAAASLREFVHSLYAEIMDRFASALSRALPQIPPTELYWRLHFLTGSVAYSMAASDTVKLFADCQLPDASNHRALLYRLIPFLAGGMKAPLPAAGADSKFLSQN
jgi:AcrR family transcriptional regulator